MGGSLQAKFVRAASGIINETNRSTWIRAVLRTIGRALTCISSSVPLTGPDGTGSPTPNPACDPNGLVMAPFTFVNTDPSIGGDAT